MGGVTAATPPGGRPMTTTVSVDPSVSRTPLPLDASDLATICVLCSHNCGVRVDVAGGRITAVRADETNPITTGYICNKGFSIPSYVNHPERVAHPLRRTADGGFEPIGWDVAIAEIAARLSEIRSRHSPRAIGLVGIGGQGNHMDAPYGLGFLRALGSRRWFNAFAQEKTQHALMDQWMFDASPAAYFHVDQRNARFMLVLGTNPRISNRGHNPTESFKHFVEDEKRTLVVVDPRETETTRGARAGPSTRGGAGARLRHPRDFRPRQLRDVLADPRPRGGSSRSSRATAGTHRRGLQPVPLVLGHTALAGGAGRARSAGGDRAGHDRDRAAGRLRPPHAGRLREV